MIDMLPRTFGQRTLPYFRNSEVRCVYCGFTGTQSNDGHSKLVYSGTKGAIFRFVDSTSEPVAGVCARYQCRQMFKEEQRVAEKVELAKL